MGGGLMQLVAYGAQDVYLSGNPQITFFKVVYRRHTNFAVEPIPQTWNGVGDFGRTVTCNINRNGDLVTHMYLYVALTNTTGTSGVMNGNTPVSWGYVRRLGHAICQMYKIEIGGSLIDQQYGDWLNIWYELTHKSGQERGYAQMIGDTDYMRKVNNAGKNASVLYVPFQFWFNRNNGLALPLIALQYHDVRITCQLRDRMGCVNILGPSNASNKFASNNGMDDCNLLIDYVYLDSEERKRFAQASHEYLIEQLQFTGSEALTANAKYRLNFNHPCKYLVWAPHFQRYNTGAQWLAYATDGDWKTAKDRFAKYLAMACTGGLVVPAASASFSISSVQSIGFTPTLTTDDLLPNSAALQGGSAAGEIVDLANISNGQYGNVANATKLNIGSATGGNTQILYSLLSKIDVKAILQGAVNTGGLSGSAAPVATSTISWVDLLQQFERNTIVTRNELTMEDISLTVTDLMNLIESANLAGPNSAVVDADTLLQQAGILAVDYFNYGNMVDGSDNPLYTGKLQLNGHDRFQDRDGNYFNYVQPYQHWSNTPADGINSYSFALKPEDHQPTGTCNFSRIDNATLLVDVGLYNKAYSSVNSSDANAFRQRSGLLTNGASSQLNIYTMNYNVLRVMSGMAGTAYSN
jgi:hypothetical protein